ncbi:MAG: radical SAM protein [Candidatus Sumerlaeia bacterium]|nr:radical SAM protein [Candidatus Sumerlaeia bacterium]
MIMQPPPPTTAFEYPSGALTPAQQQVLGKFRMLTMFVTNLCNAKCETCFYWMNLNDMEKKNLSLEQLQQLASTMPPFEQFLVSGGEPVMRKELAKIVDIFAKTNGIKTVDIPTNGLLKKRVLEVVEEVLETNPHVMVTVGHSLDGFKETHDRLRGVPNNFEKLFDTFEALTELRSRRMELHRQGKAPLPRLRLLTLTCINNQNIHEVEALADWVTTNHDVDGMMFECLRGTPKDPNLLPPTPEQFDRIVQKSIAVNDALYRKRFPEDRPNRLAILRGQYRNQRDHITKGKIGMTCQAGNNLAVLEPDGRIRFCELLDVVGDLRDVDFDFRRVWFSNEAVRQRQWIHDCRCSCTHCVNLTQSIDYSPATKIRRVVDEFVYSVT